MQKTTYINTSKLNINKLKTWFKNDQVFTSKDVFGFYQAIDSNVTPGTVNWRIYKLIQLKILSRIGRSKFVLGKEILFVPDIPQKFKTLDNKLRTTFPYLSTCLWSTALFNEFMQHQPGRFFLLVEVEKDAIESLFYFMKENKYSVFIEPTNELFSRYIPDEKETWIVKSLVTEAPTQKVSGINTTTIEKMLVDIFCDSLIFDAQQGSEMDIIFKEAFGKYTINESKMLRYADRRRRKRELNNYLNKVSKFRQ